VSVEHDSRFKFVAQGALVVAYRHLPRSVPSQGGKGKRGKVTEFSDRSRKRLARLLHRLSPACGVFITLTVADASVGPRRAKRRLWLVTRWLRKLGFDAIVWKQEFQARGAVHFHLLAFSWRRRPPWVEKDVLANKWGLGFVDVSFFDGGRVLAYVAKYVRKPVAPAGGGGPHGGGPAGGAPCGGVPTAGGGVVDLTHADIFEQGEQDAPGRFWGVVGRDALVWAEVALLERLPDALEGVFRGLLERVRNVLGFTPGVLYLFSRVYLTT
jgi:hypothetical protein